jgi:hypothetical protein
VGDAPQPPINDACRDAGKGAWNELEQGFFAGAPPEVPVPPPAPIRFDDLEPVSNPRVERRMRQRRASDLAPAERAELRPLIVRAGARCVPLIAWVRGRATRVIAAIPTDSSDRWMVASLAALFVLVGVSAVVIASRDGSRSTLPTTTMTVPAPVATPAAVTRESPASQERSSDSAPSAVAAPQSLAPAPARVVAPSRASAPTPAGKVAVKRHRHHRKLAKTQVAPVAQKKAAPLPAAAKSIAPVAPARPAPQPPPPRANFSR